jgi:hypothetical protein
MPPDLTALSIGTVMYTVLECEKPMMLPEPEPVPRLEPDAAIKLVRKGIDSLCEEICYSKEIAAPLLFDIQNARKATLDRSQTHICITNLLCNDHNSCDEIAYYGLITASYKLKMLKGSNKWTVEVLVRRRFVPSKWDTPGVIDQKRVGTTHGLALECDLSDKIANAEALRILYDVTTTTRSFASEQNADETAYASFVAETAKMVTHLWERLRKISSSENGELFGGFLFLPQESHERVEMRSLYDQIEHTTSEYKLIYNQMITAPYGSVSWREGELLNKLDACGLKLGPLYRQYWKLAESPPVAQWFSQQSDALISLQEAKLLLVIIRQLFADTIESLMSAPTEEFGRLHLDNFSDDFRGKRSRQADRSVSS